MSTIKEKIAKLKELFSQAAPAPAPQPPAPVPAPEPAAGEFKDYPTQDGAVVLSIDKLEVGGKVMIAGAPAPDAEYCLQDGTCVVVAGGVISEVKPAAPAPFPEPMDMSTPAAMKAALAEVSAGNPDMQKLITILSACFEYCFGYELRRAEEDAKRTAAIEAYKTGFEAQQKKATETINSLIEVMEQFAELEKEPAPVVPQGFRSSNPDKDANRQSFVKALEEMAKQKAAAKN